MKKITRWCVGAGVVLALALIALFFVQTPPTAPHSPYQHKDISIHGGMIHVDVADTQALRELGLGGRAGLAPQTGMLFVFPTDGHYAFWMKDMKFAIDIVWIAGDPSTASGQVGTVVGMFTDVAPDTYPKSFAPDGVARYVLELPAGYVAAHGVRVGDTVGLDF